LLARQGALGTQNVVFTRQKLLDLRSELNKDAGQIGFRISGVLIMVLELNPGFQEETMRRFALIISDR
jgi:hypothetical protein